LAVSAVLHIVAEDIVEELVVELAVEVTVEIVMEVLLRLGLDLELEKVVDDVQLVLAKDIIMDACTAPGIAVNVPAFIEKPTPVTARTTRRG
jgi:hypothetical protein